MAPTGAGAVEVQQLSFNELLCHLVAAHEREIIDLQTEIRQLRDSKDDASSGDASGSGSCPLEMSAFPSRQPTLASGGTDAEDCEPLTEVTTEVTEPCLLEKSEELPRAPCPTHRCVRSEPSPAGRKQKGPDAKALASALQIAEGLGLVSIDEEHVHGFEMEAEMLFSEAASSGKDTEPATTETQADAAAAKPDGEVSPDSAKVNSLKTSLKTSSLVLPEVTPRQKSFLPASPLDDHEPLPEEDKSGTHSSSATDARLQGSCSRPARERRSTSANTSTELQPKCGREWSLVSDGDAALPVNMTLNTGGGLDSGLGLSSAIWVEASDHGRCRKPLSPSQGDTDAKGIPSPRLNDSSERESSRRGLQDSELEEQNGQQLEDVELDQDSELCNNEAFEEMHREKVSSTLPSREQTPVVPGTRVGL